MPVGAGGLISIVMLYGWVPFLVFAVGTALYFGSQSKLSGFGLGILTGSSAAICIAFLTKTLRIF